MVFGIFWSMVDKRKGGLVEGMLERQVGTRVEEHVEYDSDYSKIFSMILGQLDDGVTARMKCRSNWKEIYARADRSIC